MDKRAAYVRLAVSEEGLRADRAGAALAEHLGGKGRELEVWLASSGLLIASADEAASWLCGSLDMVSVIELATIVAGAGHTGALEVQSPGGRRKLFFEQGRYTGAVSTHQTDRLGEVLWRAGRISLDQLVIAGESVEPGKRIGRVLVDLGYLTSHELRPALRTQARMVFEAAALEERGRASFVAGPKHPNPVALFEETEALIDRVVRLFDERDLLLDRIGALDVRLHARSEPTSSRLLQETEEALRQLAVSAKTPQTGHELLAKSKLAGMTGLRALAGLLDQGYLEAESITPAETKAPERPRLDRLVEAVTVTMRVLSESGFGVDDAVREFAASPPADQADAIGLVDLDSGLDATELRTAAGSLKGGVERLEQALHVLLDFAVFEARDTLPEDVASALVEEIMPLNVLL